MAVNGKTLLIIERAYRGSVESQFADALYFVRGLHGRNGGIDLALRGLAASYAVEARFDPAIRVADRVLGTPAEPRRSLRRLLDDGMCVLVEEQDVAAVGASARERLVPGIQLLRAHELAARWPDYERVWFF